MTGDHAYPEFVLLDEPTTADLRTKVTDAWREFARALARLLPALAAGAILELTLDPTASGVGQAVFSVSVTADGDGELTALAVGNALLPDGYRLDRQSVASLVALGWSPPGVVSGSGGYFGLRTATGQAAQLAGILCRTMRDIYGAPHPAFLVYLVHDEKDGPLPVPPLGTARPEARLEDLGGGLGTPILGAAGALRNGTVDGPGDVAALQEQVRTVVAALMKSDPDQLQVDSDGDIGIREGSAMVFVRVRDNPPLVDVFSPVLTEIAPTEQLYVKLSELTNRMPIGRLYHTNDTVWASIPVFGRSFQPSHLMVAIQVMTKLADELDDRLHGEFGGRRFFGEGDKPRAPEQSERTGMYL